MSRRQQRDRIEQALKNIPGLRRHVLNLDSGGHHARGTLAGLLCDAFAPELARGRDAEDTIARVRAALRGLPADGTVPVRAVLDALYGEEPKPVTAPFNTGQYWTNPGDDSVTLHCRICEDGIFARPGDQYWVEIGPAPGLDLLNHIAQQHHDANHHEQP